MNIYAPDYYIDFKCIANQCKHNCCIGWEIDIDEDTYDKYRELKGDFGNRLCEGINTIPTPHFCMTGNDRCPFLNRNNLCDIITNLGEEYLCQICNDHPRFRNFFSDREEIGLGLCCESAAELILTWEKKTEFVLSNGDGEDADDEETAFFSERDRMYGILQNRNLSVNDRIKQLVNEYELSFPRKSLSQWASTLKKLERLEPKWDTLLNKLEKSKSISYDGFAKKEWEIAREQMLIYFVYRHTAEGFYGGDTRERLAFAVISDKLLMALCAAHRATSVHELADIARQYSAEIEYSEENMEALLSLLKQAE